MSFTSEPSSPVMVSLVAKLDEILDHAGKANALRDDEVQSPIMTPISSLATSSVEEVPVSAPNPEMGGSIDSGASDDTPSSPRSPAGPLDDADIDTGLVPSPPGSPVPAQDVPICDPQIDVPILDLGRGWDNANLKPFLISLSQRKGPYYINFRNWVALNVGGMKHSPDDVESLVDAILVEDHSPFAPVYLQLDANNAHLWETLPEGWSELKEANVQLGGIIHGRKRQLAMELLSERQPRDYPEPRWWGYILPPCLFISAMSFLSKC